MKEYKEKKICFIICTNDENQLQECLLYLSLLEVPEGYETEILTITDAKSMAAGYNEGMNASNARYKVYLHQDVFIREASFIEKILKIFHKDKKIGMIGMIGSERLPWTGVMWHDKRCGNIYKLSELIQNGFDEIELIKRGIREVEAVDGFLMVTQYDIPWREDILKGWDFYDVSQCMEFRRKGYKIVVPGQKRSWTVHNSGFPVFWNYEEARELFLKEYPEIAQSKQDKLRIVHFNSTQIALSGVPYCFLRLGHVLYTARYAVNIGYYDENDVENVEEILEEGHYDMAFTYDFSEGTAEACKNMGVKYYAWVYDNPLLALYSKQAKYEYNYVSVFDKKQYERMQCQGLKHLLYLPLSSEIEVFGSVSVKEKDIRKYTCDIAFVGRLYDNRGYEESFDPADPDDVEMRKTADEIAESCQCIWDGTTNVFDKASDELIRYMVSKTPSDVWQTWDIDKRYFCESMKLARKCNEIERVRILNSLAEKYEVVLYSDDSPKDMLHNVTVRPWVDYFAVMPKIFYLSKINLNITSRSIESGIPQRVWDILSVGGFCLTNYQSELEDYFVIGRDLEVYHDLDELHQKVDYYLHHEEERLRIAIHGYQTVREKHDTKERLKHVIDFINKESEEPYGND